MSVRTVGIDLAITGPNVCVLVDAQYNKIGSAWKFREDVASLEQMWSRCRAGLAPGDEVTFVMEPTGHAWLRVVAFLRSKGEKHLYVPSMRKFSALRKTLNVGVKNDELDALALAKLPAVAKEVLRPVIQPTSSEFALKRVVKLYEQVTTEIVRMKTRLQAFMTLLNPGVMAVLAENDFTEAARQFIREVWDPRQVSTLEALRAMLVPKGRALDEAQLLQVFELCKKNAAFVEKCSETNSLPASPEMLKLESNYLLTALEQAEVRRAMLVAERDRLVKQLDPDGVLQTLVGIGPQIASVIYAYSSPMTRFTSVRAYKGYVGLVPGSTQSGGDKQAKGRRITKAGPNPLKAAYYQAAMVAVLWDPELAAFAVRLQDRGLAYAQVMVAVANKLMARAYAVVKRKALAVQSTAQPAKPAEVRENVAESAQSGYELRTPQGAPISKQDGKELVDSGYRLKTARRQNPQRGSAGAGAQAEASEKTEERKTSPESARQSLAPQPGTALTGNWECIIAQSACPPDLKRLLTAQTALLEVTDSRSLRDYLGTQLPDPLVIQAQLRLLEKRVQQHR